MGWFSDIGNFLSGGVGSLLGGVVSGVGSLVGGMSTNSANQDIAHSQEEFQADMSGTAYQRAVADMEKAGLNPMLAYSQGGATAPSGAAIAMQNPFPVASGSFQQGVSSFASAAQVANTEADTLTKLANLPEKQVGGDIWGKIHDGVSSILDRISSSAGSITSRDLPPVGSSAASEKQNFLDNLNDNMYDDSPSRSSTDWLTQLEEAGAAARSHSH
jgi:hypothetical protein